LERNTLRVLVCGGRDFKDWELFDKTLLELDEATMITDIIAGGAKGADTLAQIWAAEFGVNAHFYHADWDTYGRAAGPIRNKQMLDEGKPDLVVAFPGGRGTANMVKQAREAGVKVIEIEKE
jgi:hypothetical protein